MRELRQHSRSDYGHKNTLNCRFYEELFYSSLKYSILMLLMVFSALIFCNIRHCLWQRCISDRGTETVTTFMSPQLFSFHTNAVGTILRFSY